jgi:hypothetical protein
MRSFFKKPSSSLLQRIQRGCAALAALIFSNIAVAGIVFDVNEVGPDVVATVSGSFASLPTSLGQSSTSGAQMYWVSGWSRTYIYPVASTKMSVYGWATGGQLPTYGNKTTTSGVAPDTSTVNTAMQIDGVFITTGGFRLDQDYILGDAITGTLTWTGKDYSNLGFDPGTYVGTLTNGETITLNINAAPVPEPSTGALAAFVLGGTALGVARRRRKQAAAATSEQAV